MIKKKPEAAIVLAKAENIDILKIDSLAGISQKRFSKHFRCKIKL